tara:strand:- start:1065 stop:1241 length:177 start_codon:yes stop_codon:yes gene_type:complete
MTEFEQMTDFEIAIDDDIAKWYHNNQHEGDYFNTRKWRDLFDEQKQVAAQLFWKEMLS